MARSAHLPPIVVRCSGSGSRAKRPFTYQIAGQQVVSDRRLEPLAPFAVDDGLEIPSPSSNPDWPQTAAATRFDDRVWLGGREQHLICRAIDDRCWLEAEGLAGLLVDLEVGAIDRLDISSAGKSTIAAGGDPEDLVIGPALTLLLAARGTYCLHASAVVVEGRVKVFLGDSGAGKSTLVAETPLGVERLADDILPVSVVAELNAAGFDAPEPSVLGPTAWPAYPQLKLPPDAQQVAHPAVPVQSIALLEAEAPADGALLEITPVSAGDATLLLARHTVAAKLFPPPLLDTHLRACVGWAQSVPISRVRFRRDLSRIAALRRDLFLEPPLGVPPDHRD